MATYDLTPEQKVKERAKYYQLLKEGHSPSEAVYILDRDRGIGEKADEKLSKVVNIKNPKYKKIRSNKPSPREEARKNNKEKIGKAVSGILTKLRKVKAWKEKHIVPFNERNRPSFGLFGDAPTRRGKREPAYKNPFQGGLFGPDPVKKKRTGRKTHKKSRKSNKSRRGKQIIINI